MSSGSDASDLAGDVGDLVTALQELQAELEPRTESGLPRPPTPSELARFTSEVGIPAIILILRTNIEVLKLLQRALRLADGRRTRSGDASEVRQRAEQVSRATLSRLDDALADLQNALEGTPGNEEARELLDEARELRADVEDRIAEQSATDPDLDSDEVTDVPVDVDAELQSIKDDLDDAGGDGRGATEGDHGGEGDGDAASDDALDGGGDATTDDDRSDGKD